MWPLVAGRTVRVGCAAGCQWRVSGPGVRSVHFALRCSDTQIQLLPAAPLHVDGEPCTRARVVSRGARVQFGGVELRLWGLDDGTDPGAIARDRPDAARTRCVPADQLLSLAQPAHARPPAPEPARTPPLRRAPELSAFSLPPDAREPGPQEQRGAPAGLSLRAWTLLFAAAAAFVVGALVLLPEVVSADDELGALPAIAARPAGPRDGRVHPVVEPLVEPPGSARERARLERAGVDHLAAGRFAEALDAYRRLAAALDDPAAEIYRSVVRVLERELAGDCGGGERSTCVTVR